MSDTKRTITSIGGDGAGQVWVWLGDRDGDRWEEAIVLPREEALNVARAILDTAVKPERVADPSEQCPKCAGKVRDADDD